MTESTKATLAQVPEIQRKTANGEFVTLAEVAALCAALKELAQALESVMIGGNHLANQLIAQAACMPYRDTSYEEQLSLRGETYPDIWACWKATMDARDGLLPSPPLGAKEKP